MTIKDFAAGLAALCCAGVAVAICMIWIDAPLAAQVGTRYHFAALETFLGGIVLTGSEFLVLAALFVAARYYGKTGDQARTLMLACGTSILAYGCNLLFKIVFGRPVPLVTAHLDRQPVFHFFHGDHHSSFPSSHMALLGAFAGVLWQAYPRTRPFLLLFLCLAGAAIVAGNWHYVSDTIAGAALGLCMGTVAASFGLKPGRRPA